MLSMVPTLATIRSLPIRTLSLLAFSIIFHSAAVAQLDKLSGKNIYLDDLKENGRTVTYLSKTLTEQIETVLVSKCPCQVLQRRKYARMLEEAKNESHISDQQSVLKALGGQVYVYGDLITDVPENTSKLSLFLTFQDLTNGVILLKTQMYLDKISILDSEYTQGVINQTLAYTSSSETDEIIKNVEGSDAKLALAKLGISYTAESFAQALERGDMDVADLFLHAGFPVTALHKGAAVLIWGVYPNALAPKETVALLHQHGFDFNTPLVDQMIMPELSDGSLPIYFRSDSLADGYEQGKKFKGPLMLWLSEMTAYLDPQNHELELILYLKQLGFSAYLTTVFCYRVAAKWGATSSLDVMEIVSDELISFHNSQFSEYYAFKNPQIWPDKVLMNGELFILFEVTKDKLVVGKSILETEEVLWTATDFLSKARANHEGLAKKVRLAEEWMPMEEIPQSPRASYLILFLNSKCDECLASFKRSQYWVGGLYIKYPELVLVLDGFGEEKLNQAGVLSALGWNADLVLPLDPMKYPLTSYLAKDWDKKQLLAIACDGYGRIKKKATSLDAFIKDFLW